MVTMDGEAVGASGVRDLNPLRLVWSKFRLSFSSRIHLDFIDSRWLIDQVIVDLVQFGVVDVLIVGQLVDPCELFIRNNFSIVERIIMLWLVGNNLIDKVFVVNFEESQA